jgi:PEP-CTERM motif
MRVMLRAGLCALLLVGAAAPARADIIFSTGQGTVSPDENVAFGGCLGCVSLGNPVIGATNNTGLLVSFTSDELLNAPSSGQARVESLDADGFDVITIDMVSPTLFFSEFETNVNIFAKTSGIATVTACNQLGDPCEVNNYSLGSGENFFVLSVISPQLIDTVKIESTTGIMDLRQTRVTVSECLPGAAGCQNVTVPEPASMALFGVTLLAGGWRFRRKIARS